MRNKRKSCFKDTHLLGPHRVFLGPVLLFLFALHPLSSSAQLLPGFEASGTFGEQQMLIRDASNNTRILINAPLEGFGEKDRVLLVFYALPNGNSIEHTFGKILEEGDDWHYDIQHIGAQTRFLRRQIKGQTLVVVYLEAGQKSWPLWKSENPDYRADTKRMVDEITTLFHPWDPELVLNGHSGGGRFIFSYLEAEGCIPNSVKRIAFLDSSYGYEDSIHGSPLLSWLNSGDDKYLCTLAYNDSVVIYGDKPLVSPTGGTWYRSKLMKDYLAATIPLKAVHTDSLLWFTGPCRRIQFILKTNPEGKIYHTVQVERNGFIHSVLSGTEQEQQHYSYFGERAYKDYITEDVLLPSPRTSIPDLWNVYLVGANYFTKNEH